MDSGYSLKSITGYNEYDARSRDYITASPVDSLTINGLTERTEYTSQEFRLESPGDKQFRFIAGVFADRYEMRTLPRDGQYAALNLGGSVLPNFVNNLASTPSLGFLNALIRQRARKLLHVNSRTAIIKQPDSPAMQCIVDSISFSPIF